MNVKPYEILMRWEWGGSAVFLIVGIDIIRGGVSGRSFLGSLGTGLREHFHISSGRWIAVGIAMLTCSLALAILSVRKQKKGSLTRPSPPAGESPH